MDEINPRGRVFRRKRKFQGATWTPPSMSAETNDGAWCRACKKRHGYKTAGLQYTKNGQGQWMLLWLCPVTKDVIEEMVVSPNG